MSVKTRVISCVIKCIGFFPLVCVRSAGAILAMFVWMLQTREAKISQTNIDICFPLLSISERRKLARQSLIETGKLALEICSVWANSQNWLQKHVKKVHGEQVIIDALACKKGVIILAPHFGNWEVLGRYLPDYAATTNLYQPPKKSYIEPIMRSSRERDGAVLAPANLRGVSQILSSLKKGGISGILPDQCPDQGAGIFSSFCGYPAYTMTLVHGLIQRTHCKVVLATAKRVKSGFELFYMTPDEGIYDSDLQTSVNAMNKTVEQCISLAPEQYQWEYKRFKKTPEGHKPLYQYKK